MTRTATTSEPDEFHESDAPAPVGPSDGPPDRAGKPDAPPPGPTPPLPSARERRRLREARNLSEEQLARMLGVTRATVRSWENGRTTPRGRKRQAYARILHAVPETPPDTPVETPPETPVVETGGGGESTGADPVPREATAAPEPAADTEPAFVPASEAVADTEPAPEAEPEPTAGTDADTEQAADAGTDATAATAQAAEPSAEAVSAPAAAFDALYEAAAPGLVQQAYVLTGRRRLSREAVEYAFHLAWERWPEVAVDRDPAGWVRAAVHEYALSPWHRFRRSQRVPDSPGADRAAQALRAAVLELPPVYRRTLLLYDGLGLDLPETAAETEASTPAAGNRVLHARAAVAEKVPEVADPAVLHKRLTFVLTKGPAVSLAAPRSVRSGSERRIRLWTRAAIVLTVLIVGATAFTLATAPTSYEPPLAPGEPVAGVPVLSGPERSLTREDAALRDRLRSEPAGGPARLVPQLP
ncbi:helix-turn-helix domain-containing protein [Streptomyces lichenis]|uniref:Helix-turn-helix domain-containing protein n=1 Tax=Streptomyces lichenis TaxID=2306967 RepID=A0ABT0I7C8_9ACTN|nr:helix-turn-helix domain-containing protein [Streptomyces lichenis]MCK8677202.1 helix-turn-helix domain-containing protein [Streptomyces lichenis]